MTTLLENAVYSIQLGIEDYRSNDPRRPVSAARNFYAGVLLLGKQCLLNAAPNAEPMEVLASHYVPAPDVSGGVHHQPRGYRTIDLGELKERFKVFQLRWPDGDIDQLQRIRNDLEHSHSPAPKQAIRQAIAGCFPLVEGFFTILGVSPAHALGNAWSVMLEEEAFFSKQKAECDVSFQNLPWYAGLVGLARIECPDCGSSLICQAAPTNSDPSSIEGRCKACGRQLSAEETAKAIVQAEYADDDYLSYKDGGEPAINDCPDCGQATYVATGEVNECFLCGYSVDGECGRCSATLGVHNVSADSSTLCSYCDYVMSKDD